MGGQELEALDTRGGRRRNSFTRTIGDLLRCLLMADLIWRSLDQRPELAPFKFESVFPGREIQPWHAHTCAHWRLKDAPRAASGVRDLRTPAPSQFSQVNHTPCWHSLSCHRGLALSVDELGS